MKHLLSLCLVVIFSFSAYTQEGITTYYLIRHAEKIRTNKNDRNPKLNAAGLKRAQKWKEVFKNVEFDAIYSTNLNRTIETAQPTAKERNLEILFYDPRRLYSKKFQSETDGQTVLVVGHSNTTPFLANRILREEKYDLIDDNNNANLYIITIANGVKSDLLLKID